MDINIEKVALGALAIGSFAAAIIIECLRPKPPQMNYDNMGLCNYGNPQYDGLDPFLVSMMNKYCPNHNNQNKYINANNVMPNYNYGYDNNIHYSYYQNPRDNIQPNVYYNPSPVMNEPNNVINYYQQSAQPQTQTVYYQQPIQQPVIYPQQNMGNTYGEFEWEDEVSNHPSNASNMNNCQTYNSNGNGFSYYNNGNMVNPYNYSIPYAYGYNDITNGQTYNSNGNGFSYYNNGIQNGWYQNDYAFQEQMGTLQNQPYYQSAQQYQQPNILYDSLTNVQPQQASLNPFGSSNMNAPPVMGPFSNINNDASPSNPVYQSHSNVTDIKPDKIPIWQTNVKYDNGIAKVFNPGFI